MVLKVIGTASERMLTVHGTFGQAAALGRMPQYRDKTRGVNRFFPHPAVRADVIIIRLTRGNNFFLGGVNKKSPGFRTVVCRQRELLMTALGTVTLFGCLRRGLAWKTR